jgi:Ni/Co efflux regulator RcnB
MKKLLAILIALSFVTPIMAAEPAAAKTKQEQTKTKKAVKKHKKFDGDKVPTAPAKPAKKKKK